MYLTHYGFKEPPFALTPDPGFLFLALPHRRALLQLEYCLTHDTGFCLLTGEVGSGKTTLIRHLLNTIDRDVTVGLISNTSASFGRLLQWVCMSFELEYSGKDDIDLYGIFSRFLIDQYAKGKRVVLIVDEAQNLGAARLEELRVLSNINADKHFLLQTILVGQPELRNMLRKPEMLQFEQRIGASCHVGALSAREARYYVRHRLRVAGGPVSLISESAITLAHARSRGIPRLINQYCDRALAYGFGAGAQRIDGMLMAEAIKDRDGGDQQAV
jgi:general secretion pathway protein A